MRLSYKRILAILFAWFAAGVGVWFCYLWIISLSSVQSSGYNPYPFDVIGIFKLVLGFGTVVLGLLGIMVAGWVTWVLASTSRGFNKMQNTFYIGLTVFAVLLMGFFTLSYVQILQFKLMLIGVLPAIAIVWWAIKGAYLLPRSTAFSSSTPPPARPQPPTSPSNPPRLQP